MESYELPSIIFQFLPRIPTFLVAAGGIIYALMQISKNRTISFLVIAGLGLMFILEIAGIIMSFAAPMILRNGGSAQTYTYVWGIYSIIVSLLWTLSLVLILIAVWKKRPAQQGSEFPPQPDAYKNTY